MGVRRSNIVHIFLTNIFFRFETADECSNRAGEFSNHSTSSMKEISTRPFRQVIFYRVGSFIPQHVH